MTSFAIAYGLVAVTGIASCTYLIANGYDVWCVVGVAVLTILLLPSYRQGE